MNLIHRIKAASQRIASHVYCTPLVRSPYLSSISGANVYLKCEHLQHTGSFKFRGALNKILSLSPEERNKGVIAASTGNHGLAIAYAAGLAQTRATIFLPQSASEYKKDSILLHGATIEYIDGDCLAAELTARIYAKEKGKVFISPYNDIDVIAGQGTIALEMHSQQQTFDAVFVSVGGGGLISGVGSFIKHVSPQTKVIACWPYEACAMYECLKAGSIILAEEQPTLSEATAGNVEPDSITFEICQQIIDQCLLVSEQEISRAMLLLAEQERWITEGSAGVALAAFLQVQEQYKGKNVAILVCGRNITLSHFLSTISDSFKG